MIFMPFIGLQAFKVKLFSEKSLASKSNSQESPFLHFFFFSTYNRKVVTVLTKSISLVLGLQMIKNHLKEQATVLICIFAQPIWISLFLFFFFILKTFISSSNTPGRVSSCQISSLLDMYFK